MKKYEYLALYYSCQTNMDVLNELGDKGWSLITTIQSQKDPDTYRWIFRREKSEDSKSIPAHLKDAIHEMD